MLEDEHYSYNKNRRAQNYEKLFIYEYIHTKYLKRVP